MQYREPYAEDDVPRRGFLAQFAAWAVGLIVTGVPAAVAALFVANPIFRPAKRAASSGADRQDGFIRLAVPPEAVPADGTPISATVVANRSDAWNYCPEECLGTIWLRRDEKARLIAFSSICPHLGCRVIYHGPGNNHFHCPCHDSQFTLDGVPTNQIPPRPMDQLETKLVDGCIWVRYLEFRGGIPEKVPV